MQLATAEEAARATAEAEEATGRLRVAAAVVARPQLLSSPQIRLLLQAEAATDTVATEDMVVVATVAAISL